MNLTGFLLTIIAIFTVWNMFWLAAIYGKISGGIERHEKAIRRAPDTVDYRKPHIFDPIGYAIDECECGLTGDAEVHT